MNRQRILVVEDEAILLMTLRAMLDEWGYLCSFATSGEEALEEAARTPFDLILMDVRLRGEMDGVEAASQICSRSGIPIVYLTAHSDQALLERAQEELERARDELEARVQERTGELLTANMDLTAEIAERRKVELRLRESEEKYRSLVETTSDCIWEVDPQGRFTYLSPSFRDLLGYDPADFLGHSPEELIPEDEAAQIIERFKAMVSAKQPFHLREHYNRHRDGRLVAVEVRGAPFFDSAGEYMGMRGVTRDATDRKRAEEERRQIAKAESLNRMAGAIAHNFNNMLGAVIGNLEMASDEAPQGSDLQTYIGEALEASLRAAKTSRFMLTYLGQAAGKLKALDFVRAIRETAALLNASIPTHVHLKTHLPPAGPAVMADGAHFTQILSNLIENAVEAIGENEGDIDLAVDVVAGDEIPKAKLFPPDWSPKAKEYACLSVADTGVGIDPEVLGNIFDPFFSTKFAGRGLGLAVVTGLLRALDGAVFVESHPGRGSVFRALFPLADQGQTPEPHGEIVAAGRVGAHELVLVVDDEETVRRMAETMLRRKVGCEVIAACDGSEAVEIFKERKGEITLVLLDLSMPGMDGWETLAALRAVRPDIPVVLSSGYDEAHACKGEHLELPQAFLPKPYGAKELTGALAKARSRKAQEE